MSRLHIATLSTLLVTFACTKERSGPEDTGANDMGTSSGDGDGDGDGSTTVPGNTTDDDPSTDTQDPDTDTDDPSTDTQDPDPDTDDPSTDTDDPTDGCSEGDSGIAPFDEHVYDNLDEENEPYGGSTLGFVPDDDIGGVDACDVFLQDCPDGEKCVPYSTTGINWDANKCVPVMGNGMVGDPCLWGGIFDATDNCDENTACWGINNQGQGVCTLFCGGTPQNPVCPEGTACIQGNSGSIAFCEDSCNPLTQNCPEGSGCYWGGDSFTCTHTTTNLALGEPCGFINDCSKGFSCVPASLVPNCFGQYCCAQFCDLDCGQGTCDYPGTSCVPFFDANAPAGDEDVGLCVN